MQVSISDNMYVFYIYIGDALWQTIYMMFIGNAIYNGSDVLVSASLILIRCL